jgi:WD40 repeat protein
MWEKFPD